jgi:hypothetical protein
VARLIRVRPGEDPGYRRIRAGSGFRYADMSGSAAPPADRQRIHDLVIPPAWEDVWIAVDPNAHIQAVGVDDAGRRQYLYHPRWRERRDRRKFSRALDLAAALPRARGRVTSALRRDDLDRERVLAASFRLLDEAAPRIGSARYLEQHGTPRAPLDLLRHNCITTQSSPMWSFLENGRVIDVGVSGNLVVTGGDAMRQCALLGLGVVQSNWWTMREDVVSGALVPLLEPYAVEGRPISVVYPSARHIAAKVRALIDFLVEITRLPPEVEQRLQQGAHAVRSSE